MRQGTFIPLTHSFYINAQKSTNETLYVERGIASAVSTIAIHCHKMGETPRAIVCTISDMNLAFLAWTNGFLVERHFRALATCGCFLYDQRCGTRVVENEVVVHGRILNNGIPEIMLLNVKGYLSL